MELGGRAPCSLNRNTDGVSALMGRREAHVRRAVSPQLQVIPVANILLMELGVNAPCSLYRCTNGVGALQGRRESHCEKCGASPTPDHPNGKITC
jgi:hypothetical protein